MNEPTLETPLVEATTVPAYKNRTVGLIIFGIWTILLGSLTGLNAAFVLFTRVAVANVTHQPANVAALLPVLFIYGGLAVTLIWLGIGSILCRRWARALLLVLSWSGLIVGILTVAGLAFVLPDAAQNLPAATVNGKPVNYPQVMTAMMVIVFGVLGVLFVILPAVWAFFYSSRHVKATCEARDPVTRWTDACPLPVLGLCVWLAPAVPMMPIMGIANHGVMPFFGMFLVGMPGSLIWVALAAVRGYASWLLYRLDVRDWWLILVALLVVSVSGMVTYAHHDLTEMTRLMGYPEAQMEVIQKTGLLTSNRFKWVMSLSMVPYLGYLLFIKKYFRPSASSRPQTDQ